MWRFQDGFSSATQAEKKVFGDDFLALLEWFWLRYFWILCNQRILLISKSSLVVIPWKNVSINQGCYGGKMCIFWYFKGIGYLDLKFIKSPMDWRLINHTQKISMFIEFITFDIGSTLGIQIRKSKIHLNMETLSIDCRNKHWPQCFNQILISSAGSTSITGEI